MRTTATGALPGTVRDPLYPSEDGNSMGETSLHILAVILLREGLEDFFAVRSDVCVASNMVLYYDRGNPSGRRDPDVLVALGVGNHLRRSFRVWEEQAIPNTVFEVSSETTVSEDIGPKRDVYERIGIPEYFLFDPHDQFLNPVLQGFRLVNGTYVALQPAADGSLTSQQLGLRLVPEGRMLRLVDANTAAAVLTRRERIEQEQQRADDERQRADNERRRADDEKRRADQLAEEVRRLQALLNPPQPPSA
jgi:Uma2 family endonuclease